MHVQWQSNGGRAMTNKQYRKRRNLANNNVPRAPDYCDLIDGNYSRYIVGYCKRKGGYLTQGLVNVHKCDKRHCEQYEKYER